jgi:SAM-dependent methyltransferase
LINQEEIILAYRLMLGRDPENMDVVNNLRQNVHSIKQLSDTFINSAEFKQRIRDTSDSKQKPSQRHPFNYPSIPVELELNNEQLSEMFDRIHQEWEYLGETDPFWSVVTQPQYHLEHFEESREQFYLSGKYACDIFLASLRRNKINHQELNICLEVGCGVGRVTNYLAKSFNKVIATDISSAHLAYARQNLEKEQILNVEFQLWDKISSLHNIDPVDAIYSVITLQHNPPPVIVWIVQTLLSRLKPNGVASLQIPTYKRGYLFEVERYLNSPAPKALEMHFLPQYEIFKIIRETGCVCLEVREDGMVGDEDQMLSNTFIIKRPL